VGATRVFLQLNTSGVVASVRDAAGSVVDERFVGVETRSPRAGWVEVRPEAWWDACHEAVHALAERVSLDEVDAVSVGGALRGMVLVDGDGEVIRAAMVGGDGRLAGGVGAAMGWLRSNEPIAFKRVRRVLTPVSYLRFLMTGEAAVDAEDAEGTGLFDVATGRWSEAVCAEREINFDLLPRVLAAGEAIVMRDDVAAGLWLRAGTVVVSG
jgi:xylulokinase